MNNFALKDELIRRGCTTAQMNSKVVELIDQMLSEYTDTDVLRKYKSQIADEFHALSETYHDLMTKYQYQATKYIQESFDSLNNELSQRIGNIESSTQLLEENLTKIEKAESLISEYERKINILTRELKTLEVRYISTKQLLDNLDDEINRLRRESTVENEDMKESLAFQRDALKNNLDAVKESGVEMTPELMASVISASSYAAWRQLDPKNQKSYQDNSYYRKFGKNTY